MKKKIFLSLVLFLFASNIFAQSGWIRVGSDLPAYSIVSVRFFNSQTGYVACDNNGSFKTTNSGLNWISLNCSELSRKTSIAVNQNNVIFVTGRGGYVIGPNMMVPGGKIAKSTNDGNNWSYQESGDYIDKTMSFISVINNYVIAGGLDLLVYSSNSGVNWVNVNRPSIQHHRVAKIFSADSIAVLSNNNFYSTTNRGASWSSSNLAEYYGEMHFVNFNTGYIAGSNVMKTTNNGTNWQIISSIQNVTDMDFLNASTGFLATETGKIYKTINGGTDFNLQYHDSLVSLYGIDLIDENNIWAVGGHGVLLRTSNGGVDVNHISSEIPEQYLLKQNYPNPFNPSTRINYELKITNYVTLKVFDLLGKEVAQLVNEKQNAGSYAVDFNSSEFSLPSGIYFYTLNAGEYTETRKMILVK